MNNTESNSNNNAVALAGKRVDLARVRLASATEKRRDAEHAFDFAPEYRRAEFNLGRRRAYARRAEQAALDEVIAAGLALQLALRAEAFGV